MCILQGFEPRIVRLFNKSHWSCIQDNAGYNPRLFLGDFTGNKVNQILISIDSGGSGGIMYHFVYSYINNVAQIIFNYKAYNGLYQYTVTFKNNYKVEVVSEQNKL